MKLGTFFARDATILVAYDKVSSETRGTVLEQIDEIKKYYTFSSLPEYCRNRRGGRALLAFENPRKGVFLHVLPVLVSERIPFTLFLWPECIGTNRLPHAEEREIARQEYPLLSDSELSSRPFPFHKTDPMDYFVTWGKIRELPPHAWAIGVNLLDSRLSQTEVGPEVEKELNFIKTQLGRPAEIALCESSALYPGLAYLGICGVVTAREGVIKASTALFDLPRYRLEKND